MAREQITFQCGDCKRKNYTSMKNKKTHHGAAGAEEVLPVLPEARGAQGDQVGFGMPGPYGVHWKLK